MAVRDDCRHYVMQTTVTAERLERCKLGVNEQVPFACPKAASSMSRRSTSSAGWKGVGGRRRPADRSLLVLSPDAPRRGRCGRGFPSEGLPDRASRSGSRPLGVVRRSRPRDASAWLELILGELDPTGVAVVTCPQLAKAELA